MKTLHLESRRWRYGVALPTRKSASRAGHILHSASSPLPMPLPPPLLCEIELGMVTDRSPAHPANAVLPTLATQVLRVIVPEQQIPELKTQVPTPS